jgi:hypothetical protein
VLYRQTIIFAKQYFDFQSAEYNDVWNQIIEFEVLGLVIKHGFLSQEDM